MKTNKNIDIDIVVPWVNGADPVLNKKRDQYRPSYGGNQKGSARYRDWGIFKYFFRAIEANAPWVHKVYLVTDNQLPDFINTNCDKLVIVDHKEYIPKSFYRHLKLPYNYKRLKWFTLC